MNSITENGYFISAPWRSSGKTIFSVGLARAAYRCELSVQTFKKGPDFIDPLWLATASKAGCYNLDPYIQQNNQWQATFTDHINDHSLALVEGTMGLHDGLQADGSDSNASVARTLNLPVILVVDCRGMHRTVAALINGIQQFDPDVQFAGVVLNRVRSTRHKDKIVAALAQHSEIELLGVIPETRNIHIDEKQLGLTPAADCANAEDCINYAADLVAENCDLDRLFARFKSTRADAYNSTDVCSAQENSGSDYSGLRIGIARDEAFHFYYQDDLDTFKTRGVELVEVSPVHDSFPKNLDGFVIGGGFPERHAQALAENPAFSSTLQREVENGLPVHAECAGLMYLCNRIVLEHGSFDMVGAIDGDVQMCTKPQGRGYMMLKNRDNGNEIRAHEFHHSKVTFGENKSPEFMFDVLRGYGVNGNYDGIVCNNVNASFAHFRHTQEHPWIDLFLQRVLDTKQQKSLFANAL